MVQPAGAGLPCFLSARPSAHRGQQRLPAERAPHQWSKGTRPRECEGAALSHGLLLVPAPSYCGEAVEIPVCRNEAGVQVASQGGRDILSVRSDVLFLHRNDLAACRQPEKKGDARELLTRILKKTLALYEQK